MIDGLKLTFTGEELCKLLEERIASHNTSAERWRHEQTRTHESETEDEPLLPDHICEHEMERHVWRASVFEFIRDHVDAQETYRLGADDLEFGEILPSKPQWIEQEEYEERTAIGVQLEQLAKRIGGLGCGYAVATDGYQPPAGYKVTRVDVEDGPEITLIQRTDDTK